MTHEASGYGYGLWPVVVVNSLVFLIFAFSFTRPKTARDWRSFGAFSAFVVALFTEMYGFPLTIYLLSGWLQTRYPHLDIFSHDAGHLWATMFGLRGDPHFTLVHTLSNLLLVVGFLLLSTAWRVLYRAQRSDALATSGIYRLIRHPQYVGFITIMVAFLLQWPTILTMAMFPLLVTMYVHLAHVEETEVRQRFGAEYDSYAAAVPAWIPRFSATPRHAERKDPPVSDFGLANPPPH